MNSLTRFLTSSAAVLSLLAAVARADEAVVRVIDIKAPAKTQSSLLHRKPQDSQYFSAFVGTTGALKDRFKTSADTVAALEFLLGGRVGINRNTEIEVVNERSVAATNVPIQRVILHQGALWFKSDRLKKPLEIQTSGGIMGIKGTEFTLESEPNNTQLSVLEGAVEVQDNQRKLLGTAQPGDVYDLSPEASVAPKVRHVDPAELRRAVEEGPLGEAMSLIRQELQLIRHDYNDLSGRINDFVSGLDGSKPKLARPFKDAINQAPKPGGVEGAVNMASQSHPVFRWKEFPNADGYVVFLSQDANFNNILFSARVSDETAVYPSTSRPLAVGQYYWRIVPVDAEDRPLHGATQATFQVSTSS